MSDIVTRTCFLIFTEHSKTVQMASKKPKIGAGKVAVEVRLTIPTALFHPTQFYAQVDLPAGHGLSEEAIVDIQGALGMGYGKAVQLIVQPAGESSATSVEKDH